MSKDLKILQIGESNWSEIAGVELPAALDWLFCTPDEIEELFTKELQERLAAKLENGDIKEDSEVALEKIPISFSGVMLTSPVTEDLFAPLMDTVEAYAVFRDEKTILERGQKRGFFRRKVIRELRVDGNYQQLFYYLAKNLFRGHYGAKLKIGEIDVVPDVQDMVTYFGNKESVFEGEFGEEFTPLFSFRYGFPIFAMGIEIWQEYTKSEGIDVYWLIEGFQAGSLGDIKRRFIISEKQFRAPYIISPMEGIGAYNVTDYAKGAGKLSIGALHWRYSRKGLGRFVLGGERIADSKRQELFCYFNPGDMQPPLNVYFSGFRGAEGFEGFFMMKRLGAPFLLVADPRLEGGCFCMGTKELEEQLVAAIKNTLDDLGFEESDLVLSGLSMGAYGAVYYALDLRPTAVIVGKPFTNVGDTVKRLKTKLPDEFETSSDMLANIIGDNSYASAEQLNERFWQRFTQSNYPNTTFAIAYMEQDDYDGHAFEKLLSYMSDKTIHIYGKGYTGRHNDNSRSFNQWFNSQYHRLLSERFGRRLS
ncbi:accessory Sec system protein Asp2 [Streptococcus hyointestinalis]|uniref:accessory Sec system protein Asp2 n=1 Tax=Streptococcus hyointestinalis TaxID=1337 RepID=UPI0013E025EF|nr:accessory Sec system protein Asp2 [Streptococcus hyointestinalis]